MKGSKLKKLLILLLAGASVILVLSLLLKDARKKKGLPEFSGTVEAVEVNISSKIPGRLSYLVLKEGDHVKKGEVQVRLDDREARAELEKADASLDTSKNTLKEGIARLDVMRMRHASAKEEVALASAEYEKAKVLFSESERKLERIKGLHKEGFASVDDLDTHTAKYNELREALRAQEARVNASKARLKEAEGEVRAKEQEINTLRSRVRQEEANVRLQRVRLDDTILTSPIDGIVSYKVYEQGELVPAGVAVLTVMDHSRKWVRIDLDETFLGKINIGTAMRVRASGIDLAFLAEVFEIGREAGFATQRDVTRGKQDIKTFRVKLRVDDPEGALKPGMTVLVSP